MKRNKIRTAILTLAAVAAALLITVGFADAQPVGPMAPAMTVTTPMRATPVMRAPVMRAPAMRAPTRAPMPARAATATVMSPDGSRTLTVTVENPARTPVTGSAPMPMDTGLAAGPAPVTGPMSASQAMPVAPAETAPKPTPNDAKKEKGKSTAEIVDVVFKIVGGIVGLVFTILGGLGYMKWAQNTRLQQLLGMAEQAFPAVEALAAKSDNKIDDKLVEFLKMIVESLQKSGLSEMTDGERALMKDVAAKKALAEKLDG